LKIYTLNVTGEEEQLSAKELENTASLHKLCGFRQRSKNLNSVYFSYKSLFLAFIKELAGKRKKLTQI
jgi:hypothetical protein